MEDQPLIVREQDAILEVTLNRPQKLNAINRAMAEALYAETLRFADRADLRVMLIRATGKFFSAGADLTDSTMPDHDQRSMSAFRQWYRRGAGSLHPLFDEFEAIEKPIVVAHHAACFGGALEMSLSCDFRLAAASARYALPETAIGALPGSGGTSRLTRLTGPHWARWFIMANLDMTADRALAIGLVHDVYPDAEFDERVMAFCRHLAAQPPETVAAAKLAIELTADLDRAQARNVERLANTALVFGDEHRGLFRAMLDRLRRSRR
ncbi:MAG: enoyl-CoA hydratase/isomerase family protein [Alphaproteobacteria bacterium]|jgi:enoyl-CoA hydratase/carnithine racemase|nr:enoyl-CoA hydratase/isomerase family protein [Alphaproteobacteria bacterium]